MSEDDFKVIFGERLEEAGQILENAIKELRTYHENVLQAKCNMEEFAVNLRGLMTEKLGQ